MEWTNAHTLGAVAVLLPLFGSTLWFWLKDKIGETACGYLATAFVATSFACTLTLFLQLSESTEVVYFSWMWVRDYSLVDFGFLFDPLSLSLGLIVTGVGSLIHFYAAGYMHGDPGFGRFFSYLNLFVFSMLMLTWSHSLPGLFLGWEGVGACSYLLISFWFSEEDNAKAGMKAFVVNRIGDLGFLLAMFSIYKALSISGLKASLNVSDILAGIEVLTVSGSPEALFWTNIACFGLILGAAGKSAQIPLYVWLPDAMAGPTPVSALIHAATMVTAGVYLACRLQGLFFLHSGTLEIIAYIGALTAFFAATIAVFQNDIKKVLAYSTISQLGYMFLAVGITAPVAAYFHLMTHAFFKALLFLGAGAVIHGLHHEQDMRKMGGLRTKMPITFWTMTIGVLAIAGIPPLSGFFSKDEIIHAVKASGDARLPLVLFAYATSFLTAFYMGRLWIMTFFGQFRGEKEGHESPWTMTSVLIVLAVLSVFGGLINLPETFGGHHWLTQYLGSVVSENDFGASSGFGAIAIKTLIAIAGLGLAYYLYKDYKLAGEKADGFSLVRNKYYVDEFYQFVFVRNLKRLGEFFWRIVDQAIIDGVLNGSASLALRLSERFRSFQTGFTQNYVLWVFIGLVALLISGWSFR